MLSLFSIVLLFLQAFCLTQQDIVSSCCVAKIPCFVSSPLLSSPHSGQVSFSWHELSPIKHTCQNPTLVSDTFLLFLLLTVSYVFQLSQSPEVSRWQLTLSARCAKQTHTHGTHSHLTIFSYKLWMKYLFSLQIMLLHIDCM